MRTDNIPLALSYLTTAHSYLMALQYAPTPDDMKNVQKAAFRNLSNALNELGLEMGIKPQPFTHMSKDAFMAKLDGLNTSGADVEGR